MGIALLLVSVILFPYALIMLCPELFESYVYLLSSLGVKPQRNYYLQPSTVTQ